MVRALDLTLVGDIHFGKLNDYRQGEEAEPLLRKLVEKVNNSKCDAVIELGDRINTENSESDKAHLATVRQLFSACNVPVYSVLGNHDVQNLLPEDNLDKDQMPSFMYTIEMNGFTCIFLNTCDPIVMDWGGHVSAPQLEWLKKAVSKDDSPKLVFGHHALSCQPQTGNPILEKENLIGRENIGNSDEVLRILHQDSHVIAYINGHVHWMNFSSDKGIACISVPSLTEAYLNSAGASGKYCTLHVDENGRIDIIYYSLKPECALGRVSYNN
ncbi:MAG: metallophosphoesterase [Treponema sp.]|nr:metallophosphoesterase [Treponema sp.]